MLQCKCNPLLSHSNLLTHDDVIKRKHFPRYWPFVRGIHRSLVNSPYKGQWRGALMFSLIGVWRNGWANNGDAGDSSPFRPHYDVIVMNFPFSTMNHCTMGAQRIQFTQLIFNPRSLWWKDYCPSRWHCVKPTSVINGTIDWHIFSRLLQLYEDIASLGDQYIFSSSAMAILYWELTHWK